MSSTQFWVGALVPPIVKWASPVLKKFFKLTEFDNQTQIRITTKQHPSYFSVLYTLWVLTLLGTGIVAMLFIMIFGQNLFPDKGFITFAIVGLINMVGVWFILGAILDFIFWQISSENFRDYVKFRQLKSGWGYDIKQQISALLKIGIIYYLLTLPLILFLLLR